MAAPTRNNLINRKIEQSAEKSGNLKHDLIVTTLINMAPSVVLTSLDTLKSHFSGARFTDEISPKIN